MKIFLETERLILRELLPSDDEGMFALDSSPEVHKYLGNNPVKTIEQSRNMIADVRRQYIDYGIGRWAAIEKSSGAFIGWSGLKFMTTTVNQHTNFYDVGYRLRPEFWGKGYATESAKAAIDYGFTNMNLKEIIGVANVDNTQSRKALEKCGLRFVEKFEFPLWNVHCDWLKITRGEWKKQWNIADMEIIKTKVLTKTQTEQINRLWNDEYPLKLKDRFPILTDGAASFNHYIIEDDQQNVIAWAVDFEKEGEIRFSIIVRSSHKGKGLGGLLIGRLKEENPEFYGWVIDHNNDIKANGDHYKTPMAFYLKYGFAILQDQRIESEMIKAVKIKWPSSK